MDKTYEALARVFHWTNMIDTVRQYISSCDICQCIKPSNQRPVGLLQPIPLPQSRWEQVTMDLITHLPPTSTGFDAIFVIVDRLTKMVHFVPTNTNVTAVQLAHLYINNVYRLHGLPEVIISDCDPKFTRNFWTELFKTLGTTLKLSTAYHPQTDGQTELVNRTLEQMLRAYVHRAHNDWDTYLALIEFAYNNSAQASTGLSPFFLNYGRHPDTPATRCVDTRRHSCNSPAVLTSWLTSTPLPPWPASLYSKHSPVNSAQQIAVAATPPTLSATRCCFPPTTSTILASATPTSFAIASPSLHRGANALIRQLPAASSATLDHPPRLPRLPSAPVSGRLCSFPGRHEPPPAATLYPNQDEEEFEVEAILQKRVRRGQPEYLISFKGYESTEDKWLPLENLEHCKEVVHEFKAKHPAKISARRGRHRK